MNTACAFPTAVCHAGLLNQNGDLGIQICFFEIRMSVLMCIDIDTYFLAAHIYIYILTRNPPPPPPGHQINPMNPSLGLRARSTTLELENKGFEQNKRLGSRYCSGFQGCLG